MVEYPYGFEWDEAKNGINREKHGVPFEQAQLAFFDKERLILLDSGHSSDTESRYFCIGRVGNGILTVRFTLRNRKIRIFGAGFWREGKSKYEEKNQLR